MSDRSSGRGGADRGSGLRSGDGRRIPRVEKEIREVVGQYLLMGFRGSLPGVVSVTRVIASRDLKNAKILITVMPKVSSKAAAKVLALDNPGPSDELKKSTILKLKEQAFQIQAEVNRQLKMKHCPRLSFYYDEGVGHALKMETILSQIKRQTPKASKDSE